MPKLSRYFATDNRGEKFCDVHPARRLREIDQTIVLGRNWQFDAFASQGEHAFVDRCVTMAGVSESMDMRIASNPTEGGHLTRNLHLDGFRTANGQSYGTGIQAILKTSRGVNRVL